jgi:hypothetical protein
VKWRILQSTFIKVQNYVGNSKLESLPMGLVIDIYGLMGIGRLWTEEEETLFKAHKDAMQMLIDFGYVTSDDW